LFNKQIICHVHFHSRGVAESLFDRWRACAQSTRASDGAPRVTPLLARGYAGGRKYNRIAVRVDNCCTCLVFCWVISVFHCILFYVLFCNKFLFIKYNDWSFLVVRWQWTPHRVDWETHQSTIINGRRRLRTTSDTQTGGQWFHYLFSIMH